MVEASDAHRHFNAIKSQKEPHNENLEFIRAGLGRRACRIHNRRLHQQRELTGPCPTVVRRGERSRGR
jgi:hypothetical protein